MSNRTYAKRGNYPIGHVHQPLFSPAVAVGSAARAISRADMEGTLEKGRDVLPPDQESVQPPDSDEEFHGQQPLIRGSDFMPPPENREVVERRFRETARGFGRLRGTRPPEPKNKRGT